MKDITIASIVSKKCNVSPLFLQKGGLIQSLEKLGTISKKHSFISNLNKIRKLEKRSNELTIIAHEENMRCTQEAIKCFGIIGDLFS